MNICFAINNFCAGGAERVLSSIVNNLAKSRAFDIHVICFENSAEYAHFYPLNDSAILHFIKFHNAQEQLIQLLTTIRPDIVVSFLNPMNYIISLATRLTHIPHVACERNNPWYSPDNETDRRMRDEAFLKADGCLFQTNEAASYFQGRIGGLYRIIRNPISLDAHYCDYHERQNKFVAVGRYAIQKNYPFLLEAFKQFTLIFPDYKLEIYGKDSGLFHQISQVVDALALKNNVNLYFETRMIHQYIRTAKAFISTSVYEGIPNALSEAVALGIPCIATDISGSRDILKKYNSGILVPQNNHEELVKAMCCVQTKEVFMQLTQNRNRIIIENSIDSITSELLDFLVIVINRYKTKHYHTSD